MLILPVTLDQKTASLPAFALLDSGAEGLAFVDHQWASENNLQVKPTPHRITMFGFNGEVMNSVTHFATAGLRVHDHYEKQLHFLITPLGHHPVILGMPWLKMHDPTIRWSAHTLRFDGEYCRNSNHGKESTGIQEIYPMNEQQLKAPKEYLDEKLKK